MSKVYRSSPSLREPLDVSQVERPELERDGRWRMRRRSVYCCCCCCDRGRDSDSMLEDAPRMWRVVWRKDRIGDVDDEMKTAWPTKRDVSSLSKLALADNG